MLYTPANYLVVMGDRGVGRLALPILLPPLLGTILIKMGPARGRVNVPCQSDNFNTGGTNERVFL